MRYSTIGYLIREGIDNLLRNLKMTIASISIICATMFIFGIVIVIGENINAVVKSVEDSQQIQVFMYDISEERRDQILEEIKQIDGVNDEINYVSKEEALERMRERIGDEHKELLEGYVSKNPFSASFEVGLEDISKSKHIQEMILKIEDIKKITVNNDVLDVIVRLGNGIRIISLVILLLLAIISIFIISNTVKMAVYSRRKEISIMKYVGATNNFIKWPFIIEGIVIGIIAGFISIGIIALIYNVGIARLILSIGLAELLSPVLFKDMVSLIIVVYAVLGIGMGILGSSMSMKKYLKV